MVHLIPPQESTTYLELLLILIICPSRQKVKERVEMQRVVKLQWNKTRYIQDIINGI